MTLPRNGLRGVEKIEVAIVWKRSMAESERSELRQKKKKFFSVLCLNIISDFDSFIVKPFSRQGKEGGHILDLSYVHSWRYKTFNSIPLGLISPA